MYYKTDESIRNGEKKWGRRKEGREPQGRSWTRKEVDQSVKTTRASHDPAHRSSHRLPSIRRLDQLEAVFIDIEVIVCRLASLRCAPTKVATRLAALEHVTIGVDNFVLLLHELLHLATRRFDKDFQRQRSTGRVAAVETIQNVVHWVGHLSPRASGKVVENRPRDIGRLVDLLLGRDLVPHATVAEFPYPPGRATVLVDVTLASIEAGAISTRISLSERVDGQCRGVRKKGGNLSKLTRHSACLEAEP